MSNNSNVKLRVTNPNTAVQKIWEFINAFSGESRSNIVKALIQEYQSVNSYISIFLSNGLVKEINGGLYTTTSTYMVESDIKHLSKLKTKTMYLKEVPKDNIDSGIIDVKFEKKEVEKSYVEEKLYIRGYIGRNGRLTMSVLKEKMSLYPDSTQWVVLGVFHKGVNARNVPKYTLPEKTKIALENKTGLKNLFYDNGSIKSKDELVNIKNPFSDPNI